jgi:hypothetical protein
MNRTIAAMVAWAAIGLAVCPAGHAAKLFVVPVEDQFAGPSGPVLRYEVAGPASAPVADATLSDPSLDRPFGLAFGPGGELFVVNRSDLSHGSVTRFVDPQGSPSSNGTIASSNFVGPHGADFRGAELFTAQQFGSNVVRFLVSPGGASFNGAITGGLCCNAPRGVAFSQTGELFVSQCCGVDEIRRFEFDGAGNAIPNGVINGNGLNNPHDLEFSPSGELFVANTPHPSATHTVSRFTFNSSGVATANGVITHPSLVEPIGLAFSPWGELFVSSSEAPVVSRFTFDSSGTAGFNGSFAPPQQGVLDIEFGSTPPASTGPPFVADNPISHWRFGEASGTVAEDAVGSNDGRYVGGVKLGMPGAFPGDAAIRLDGQDGRVRVPDAASLDTGDSFSLELWLQRRKLSTDVGVEGLFLKGYQLYLDGSGQVVLRKPLSREIARSRVGISDTSEFHHVVATKVGNDVHIYIDGVDVTRRTSNATIADADNLLSIGAGADFFRGFLDEAAIYDYALSPAQVANHFAAAP